jgi:16S rRNA (cytosine1402-N4)-methyltransferase
MTESDHEKPARRPRYRGKNPRHFHEKYKELSPARYADDVAKVLAGGKTPAGTHRPIMVREILGLLAPVPGEIALDCTLGYGGHAQELLAAVQPGGRLLGVDADPIELPKTEARLRSLGFPDDAVVVRRLNFAGVGKFLAEESPGGVDMLIADLGLSSMQIDDPARGFSFKSDGPLDMRMNPARGQPASALLARLDVAGLARLLVENADEPRAHDVSAAILSAHARRPLTTTRSLAEAVRAGFAPSSRPRDRDDDDTVRRVFQALRIAVNDEFATLEAFLRVLPSCMKPGGRAAILTFHSGEDRRVKSAFKDGLHDGSYVSISKDVLRASAEERRANPRSTAAKLRFAIRSSKS